MWKCASRTVVWGFLKWGFPSLISSHGWNTNLVILKPSGGTVLFQQTKEWPPLVLVITENCHRRVIIKEPSIFQYLRAYVNFANPCTFPPFRHIWRNTNVGVGGMHCPTTHGRVFEYPTGGVQFLLWLFKHTYGWEWLIRHFLSPLDVNNTKASLREWADVSHALSQGGQWAPLVALL